MRIIPFAILVKSNILKSMNMKKTNIENILKSAQQAEKILKLLANAKRLMILCHLLDGPKSVGELNKEINLSQSALSQHLARMRVDGIVDSTKSGLRVYYHIAVPEVELILAVLYDIYCKSDDLDEDFIKSN